MGAELSPQSVRSCYTLCRAILNRAVEEGLILENPAQGCKLPSQKAKEMQILSPEEIQHFLLQANEDGFYALFLLELTAGLRRVEILALNMKQEAARKIDREITGLGPPEEPQPARGESVPIPQDFQPVKAARRRPGTGCVSQINDQLWEGRYSPIWSDGKKHARNVYAHTEQECEEKLAHLNR